MDLLGSNNNVDIMEGRKGRNKISTSKMLKFVKCNRLCLSNLEEKLRILFLKHMADSSGETAHTSKDSLEIRQCDCCCFSISTKKTRNLFLYCFPFINTFLLRSGLTLLAHCMWYERASEYFTRH